MRQGTGGIGVNSTQFMPGVGCEDCHMFTQPYATGQPAITGHTFRPNTTACKLCHITETFARGGDGSDTLERHSTLSFIRPGRTDCFVCHEKGFGAQGYLDTWQSRISDLINSTQANVTIAKSAATTQALMDTYNTSKFDLDLVNSSDKTRGAHNPDYAMALLVQSNTLANQVVAGGGGIVQRYDLNNDGMIEKNEAIQAVSDYFAGIITRQDAITVVAAYFSG